MPKESKVTKNIPLRIRKKRFLLNESNKQRFVEFLERKLQESNIKAIPSEGDADLLIC